MVIIKYFELMENEKTDQKLWFVTKVDNFIFKNIIKFKLGMLAYAYIPSTYKTEAEE
jgi:hypothetical protein